VRGTVDAALTLGPLGLPGTPRARTSNRAADRGCTGILVTRDARTMKSRRPGSSTDGALSLLGRRQVAPFLGSGPCQSPDPSCLDRGMSACGGLGRGGHPGTAQRRYRTPKRRHPVRRPRRQRASRPSAVWRRVSSSQILESYAAAILAAQLQAHLIAQDVRASRSAPVRRPST
jgi:hypothetical protein